MKLSFNDNQKEFNLFFNLISIYRTYAEVAEKVEIEPPISAVDVIINKLGKNIIENKFYTSTLEKENMLGITTFLLGMGKQQATPDILKLFNMEGELHSLDLASLWEYLIEHDLEF